jgi:hypothetical protein
VSIALFFLLSGFFLAALLGAILRSRYLFGIAAGCIAAVACIIVFLQPVQLPSLEQLRYGTSTTTTTQAPPGAPGAGVDGGAAIHSGIGAGIGDEPGVTSPNTGTTLPGAGPATTGTTLPGATSASAGAEFTEVAGVR